MPLPPSRATEEQLAEPETVETLHPIKVYIGIDPGKSGGIAMVADQGAVKLLVPMPSTDHDLWAVFDHIMDDRGEYELDLFACLENVHAMPGQGVASMFTFGQGLGSLRMALTAAGIPFEMPTPQSWMKSLGIPSRRKEVRKGKRVVKPAETPGQYKKRLKAKAQQLFPGVEGITDKTADALLIAEYCRRNRTGS